MSGRRENWEIGLAEEIEAAKARPWAWGEHDCASFAARCVAAQAGGGDAFALPAWESEVSARRALRALGAEDLGAAMDRLAPRLPLPFAGRGDVATVAADPGATGPLALAVIEGGGLWIAAEPAGLLRLPLSAAVAAWKTEALLCPRSPE